MQLPSGLVATPDVVVVGAGPTGLMLACELALAGSGVKLLDERTDMPNITRAFAVHARTLELLDARDMADELLTRGVPVREIAPPGGTTLDLGELPTRFGMVLIVPQSGTEKILQVRADDLGVDIVRGAEVVGLTQDGDGVSLDCAGGDTVRAGYVVGCDGAHSTVRGQLGIDFVGKQYQTHILLADLQLTEAPSETLTGVTNEKGVALLIPFGDGWFRAIVWDRLREQAPLSEPVTLGEIRDSFGRIVGHDYGMTEMRWSSRFLSERRQARHYRKGRAFLAGDAAHVHSPLGGQGMNTGIGDAMNLAGSWPPPFADPRRRGCWTATRSSDIRSVKACCGQPTRSTNWCSATPGPDACCAPPSSEPRLGCPAAGDSSANGSVASESPIRTSVATTGWSAAGCPTSCATANGCTSYCARASSYW
jgi:2-polyprenyl-6-methoxyphenol hydroxylase-like FAD-dependent oxidoreductase